MSRHPPDQQTRYGHRFLPEPYVSNSRFPTDPVGYNSRTTAINGWREKREPFEELQPIKSDKRPQYLDSPTLAPIRDFRIAQGSRQPGTSPDYGDSGRLTQTSSHFRRLEMKPSERPASAAHESRNSRKSEGEGSANSTKHQKRHYFSVSEEDEILGYLRARLSWRQMSREMRLDQESIQTRWYKVLSKDPRAAGVRYNPDYSVQKY